MRRAPEFESESAGAVRKGCARTAQVEVRGYQQVATASGKWATMTWNEIHATPRFAEESRRGRADEGNSWLEIGRLSLRKRK